MGDTIAHRSGADDADGLDLHDSGCSQSGV
jgi:hypothetical protein